MSIKFLHVADTHIGVENYGRLDSGTGLHTRLQDFIKSLRFAFEEAIKENVDLVIFAGDAYRSCDPTPTHQREFASLIHMLSAREIPIVMITGNHDSPVSYGKASSVDIFGTLGTRGVHIASEDRLINIDTKIRTHSSCLLALATPQPPADQGHLSQPLARRSRGTTARLRGFSYRRFGNPR